MRLGSEFTVHLSRLAHNLQEIKKLSPSAETLLMVKANAYGHGIKEVSQFSIENVGIRSLGCASLGEALFLRKELPNLSCDLYVFSDLGFFQPDYFSYYSQYKILPVIADLTSLDLFLQNKEFQYVPLSLKFNTGMYRLGFDHIDVEKVAQKIKKSGRKSVYHLMTHFSSSGLEKSKRSAEQYDRFLSLKKCFQDNGIVLERTSVSNSGAIEQQFGVQETHVRPGIMAYGPSSMVDFSKASWQGKNISTLKTKVLRTFMAERGTPLGYGGPVTPEKALVVVVGLGYGDGISRSYSGLTKTVKGLTGKIFGRVNMDMVSFIFPPESEGKIKQHDDFIFWDEDYKEINRMADQIGTISYELFCNISLRVPKIYRL